MSDRRERWRVEHAHILRAVPRWPFLLDCAVDFQRAGTGTKPECIDL